MKKIFWILTVLAIAVSSAFAQTTTSSLVGTVAGPDGLIPGATVVVRDNKTGNEVTTVTDEAGGFRVPNLEVGTYTVNITASGFKTFTAQEVRIEVSRDYSLAARLEVGGVQETVVVTAGEEIINSVDAEINNNVSRKQLDDLPSLGRNPLNFVTLQPGVSDNPSQQPVINGIRTSATNITIDGINVQDNYIRANATAFSPARPTVDEVEEFAVSTQANADAGFGGAQIQFSTRRGGNDFHFRLFEFNRNSALAANDFFNNANGIERPFRNRNQFGGNASGPLPFLNFGEGGPVAISGKDKLFFFFAYENLIDRQPADPQFNTVLTPNARQGIFTYTDNSGQLRQVNLFSPAFGTGITGINPLIASRFLANIPQGNTTQVGDQLNTTGYQVTQNFNQEQTNYTTRIDLAINPLNTLTGTYRYVYQDLNRADINIDDTFNTDPRVHQPSSNPFLSIGLSSAISSKLTNEVRGGFFFSNPTFLRKDPNLENYFVLPLVSNPENGYQNQGRDTKTYNIQDNATYVTGKHSFRFGGQYQRVKIDSFVAFGVVPTFAIGTGTATPSITTTQFTNTSLFPGGVPVAQRATANALLALLGGIVSAGSQTFNVTSQDSGYVPGANERRLYSYNILGFHFSDQWRITRDLTLNLGLRYDRYTPLKSENGLFLEPTIPDLNDPVSAILNPNGGYQYVGGNAGKEGLFYKADNNNFAPVVSFAYAPKFERGIGGVLFGANTVIRGGYRISYINDELVRAPDNALGGNQGLSLTANALRPGTTSTALNSRIDNLPSITTPAFSGPNRTYAQNNAAAGNFGTVFAIDPNIETPLVHEYSFGIQREIGFNTAIEVRYVGTRSKNLLRGTDFNQVNITNNGFLADFNRARANLLLTGNPGCTVAQNQGCQPLTVFPNLASGGLLTNGTIQSLIQTGQVAQLAFTYLSNNLQGNVNFVPNPNTGVA
ncbi:MAG: carboxypeptidase-like regulatory domain-containing protein, partial [Acidobacteria bacterium]|nr:carboxypeptidase-like regulatory domain-containing protein [Acidobacteriota bacterium]